MISNNKGAVWKTGFFAIATVREAIVVWKVEVSLFINSEAVVIFNVFLKFFVVGPPSVTVVVRTWFRSKFFNCMYDITVSV